MNGGRRSVSMSYQSLFDRKSNNSGRYGLLQVRNVDADQIALANVTFPNDAWAIRLATDSDWRQFMNAQIGYWDGSNFTPLPVSTQFNGYDPTNFIAEIEFVPAGGQTIPANTYLAFRIINTDQVSHDIYTGLQIPPDDGDYYYSCVTSPQSDPGYPLPELAAGILLGAGVLGVGGFMLIRRRKAAVKA
jgi:hypothetical protein